MQAGDARAVYKNSSLDLRTYKRLQMHVHNEAVVDDVTGLSNGDVAVFIRLGSDVKNNYYEYEIPLEVTPEGHYSQEGKRPQHSVARCEPPLTWNSDLFTHGLRKTVTGKKWPA